MEEYIVPQLIKYQSIDNLLEKNNKARSLFESDEMQNRNELLVPIQALRWYRFKRYDGTVSPILSPRVSLYSTRA